MSGQRPLSRVHVDRARQYADGRTIAQVAAAAGVAYGPAHRSIQEVVMRAAWKAARAWTDGPEPSLVPPRPDPDALPPLPAGMTWYCHDTGANIEWRVLSADIVRWALVVIAAPQDDALFLCPACGRSL